MFTLFNSLKGFRHSAFSKFKKIAVTATVLLLSVTSVFATHFRYGNISWTNTVGNTVVFNLSQGWRWSFFGDPAVGSSVAITTNGHPIPLYFGDGSSIDIILTVTSVNPDEDYFYGTVTITHTYASSGNYITYFEDLARISTLQNNPDGYFRVQTVVNAGSGNNSPVSTISPIIDLEQGNASASFPVPASDPEGQPLSFRLATADEAAGVGNFYVQPTGLSVNSTGVVHFSTVGLNAGNLYTTQIIIGDGVSEIGVDFIIRIDTNVGTPPYFDYSVTPADGAMLSVITGNLLTFMVKAQDNDPGDDVTLTAAGIPIGATTNPVLPVSGNPVSTQFEWTPAITDVGTYITQFKATDLTNKSATTSATIVVSKSNCTNLTSYIKATPKETVKGQLPYTIYKGYGPQAVKLTAMVTGEGSKGYKYLWSNGSKEQSRVVSPNKTTRYFVKTTNLVDGHYIIAAVTIYVVDVRCGSTNDKVQVCGGTNENAIGKCVEQDKVAAILRKGGSLGNCQQNSYSLFKNSNAAEESMASVKGNSAASVMKLSPNPANNFLDVQLSQVVFRNAKINISDATGQLFISKDIKINTSGNQRIDISSLKNGTYLLQVISSGEITGSAKFVVLK